MGYFSGLNGNKGIPFMEGRTKKDLAEVVDRPLHIEDYGFIQGDENEFAVIAFVEMPEFFYFGNAIITEALHQVDADGMKDQISTAAVTFSKRMSKKGREYMAFEFTDAE